jgi:hypothetical protein
MITRCEVVPATPRGMHYRCSSTTGLRTWYREGAALTLCSEHHFHITSLRSGVWTDQP